ncbi:Sec1-like snare protein [Punctularia strigosozonata HHB-11173 SS5]|uniref:Sec1-like snare protein n=1 Tax=Punctularia strigosozonata (strain HHB-11173) TaxID=741275 RepID=UPI00044173D3|nr:Sec1-like snare protein [Punctularia strigosozonata HHB-11173 SS5]EIN09586.1 Sec1-like snare protein [Punctularia strigosozonata HHB-11173 SS5]
MSSSLITAVRTKFLEAIRSVNPPGRWKILVIDEHSQKLLNAVLKQFDILEENVTLIESITTNRDPQQFEAIYMVMPTSENVGRIIRDFEGRQQYTGAHLFFIDGLAEPLFQRLTASAAEPYLRTLQELFVNFWPIEAQAFSLKLPGMFFSLYSPPRSESAFRTSRDRLEEDLRFISKCITDLCITLDEYPYIRYYFPSHHLPLGPLKPNDTTRPPPPPEGATRWRTNLARGDQARQFEAVEADFATKLLACMVQDNLDDYKRNNPDFPRKTERGRGTLIITDRAMDMIAPFVHEFTYQAMANDLLPIEDGTKYTYKFQSSAGVHEDKTATLSDADSVWTEVRHMHMREAIDKLMADFNKFLEENAGFKGEGAASLNDMKDMLANLPQYQEQREKFSLHLNMAQECMAIFERDKLPVVANVEQCCATGLTAEGKTPKHLVEEMVPILDSREVINANKVRIIALYILHRDGVPDEDRRRLYQHARLSLAEQDACNALVHLGVRISRGPGDRDTKKKLKPNKPTDDEYDLSRFKPLLRTVLEEHAAGRLDQSLFPYVKDTPVKDVASTISRTPTPQATSLRSKKANWNKARPATVADNRNRVMVFVAGGMTYSEMREAYQLSSALNKDIIIGSTHTASPRQYVDDLKVLELGGVGSKYLPNGLRDPRAKRSFQEYYDEKYFLKDAPPPVRQPPPQERSRLAPSRPAAVPLSPSSSFTGSTASTASAKEKEKKKRGLFRF